MKRSLNYYIATAAFAFALISPPSALAAETDLGRWSEEVAYINDHGVSVIESGGGNAMIVLETGFGGAAGPEMRLQLGRDGVTSHAADLGPLAKITGLQVFEAPRGINIADFNELHIWDADQGALIGVAPLKR